MRIGIIIAAVIALVLAAIFAVRYGTDRIDSIVAETIEEYGRAVTGTDVDVGRVDVALTAGRADVSGITIDNPDGYDTDFAVRIDRTNVALDIGSLAGDVPIVRELTLDGAVIHAEQRDAATNLTDIQKHTTATPAEPAVDGADAGRIVIERFRLANARVVLTSEYLSKPEELPLRDVVVERIGQGSGGATYAEAAKGMLTPVLAAARDAATERLRTAAAARAREEIQEEVRDETDEAREELDERLDELLDRDPDPAR